MHTRTLLLAIALPWILIPSCKGDGSDPAGGGTDTETDSGGITSSTSATTTTSDGSAGTDSATSGGSSGGTTTAGGGVGCDGKVYACTNGLDDDGDGLIDAEDPECTGPCDDDEGTFQTGIPGDNMDCKQDCFFDGNSGQGDDKCIWDLKCDPENPGEDIGCAYTGGQNCNNQTQSDECIEFCSGLTPNGCDCFGCCSVDTPNGEVHIFLNSGGDCSLDNIDACQTCTPSEDCGNDCNPEECEICFGEEEPPEGCDEVGCPDGVEPCMDVQGEGGAICPEGFYCVTGCCVNYVPPP